MIEKKYWLCLTALRHRRFIEDAMHAVGLPMGARLRLRYRRPYVSERLWAHVAHGRSIEGDSAIICLAATSNSGCNVVRPVRLAEVVGASCEGSVLVLDVSLSSFVRKTSSNGLFWENVRKLAPGLTDNFNYVSGKDTKYLERLTLDSAALETCEDIAGWEAAAASFFEVESIGCQQGDDRVSGLVPFLFYIAGLGSGVRKRLQESGYIRMEAGQSLSMDVHTIAAPGADALKDPLGEICFDLSHSSASFESSRRVRIDSRRDVRVVKFTTSALFRTVGGHLSIRSVSFCHSLPADAKSCNGLTSAKKREEIALARYDFPMKVGRVMPWVASFMVASAAGAAAYKAPTGSSNNYYHFILPVIVFALAFIGLILGFKSDKK